MGQFDAGLTFGSAQAVGLSAFRMRERLQPAVEGDIGVEFQAPALRPGGSHVLAVRVPRIRQQHRLGVECALRSGPGYPWSIEAEVPIPRV